MSTVSKPKLIIAAISSRIYVEAAINAGFDVVSIDAFADADVKKAAIASYLVDFNNNQLDSLQLIKVLDSLDLHQFVGFCFGAGLEANTSVLKQIDERIRVLGNSAKVVERCKAPDYFFGLCKDLQIPHPKVVFELPKDFNGWLQKTIGGSGGAHVTTPVKASEQTETNCYYQQYQAGVSISCLFLASEEQIEVVGYNEQWHDKSKHAPFRYGGAVSHANVSELAKKQLNAYIVKLSKAMGLVGLNSCDVICNGDDVYVLEINPRLSATMDLYKDELLMQKHMAICKPTLNLKLPKVENRVPFSSAHQVVYTAHAMRLKDDIIWPSWVRDIPHSGEAFDIGMPVCTVVADAETASLAKALVAERALQVKSQFLN